MNSSDLNIKVIDTTSDGWNVVETRLICHCGEEMEHIGVDEGRKVWDERQIHKCSNGHEEVTLKKYPHTDMFKMDIYDFGRNDS